MANRYTYAYGYKTRERAELALEDMFAGGEVSEGEHPRIETYQIDGHALELSRKSPIRYCITVEG